MPGLLTKKWKCKQRVRVTGKARTEHDKIKLTTYIQYVQYIQYIQHIQYLQYLQYIQYIQQSWREENEKNKRIDVCQLHNSRL